MVTVFTLGVFSLLLVSFSAGYTLGREHNRNRRPNGGFAPPAASRSASLVIDPTTVTTATTGVCFSSGGTNGGPWAVPVTRLAHPEPNSWRADTGCTASKVGTHGRTPPEHAGSSDRDAA